MVHINLYPRMDSIAHRVSRGVLMYSMYAEFFQRPIVYMLHTIESRCRGCTNTKTMDSIYNCVVIYRPNTMPIALLSLDDSE